jgi:lipoprotein signal peptidase
LRWWPVFNVADIGIVCGAIAVAISMFVSQPEEIEGTQ